MADSAPAVDYLEEATSAALRFSDLEHPGEGLGEHVGHVLRTHPGRRMKAEASCARLDDRPLLTRFAPDPLVLGQDDPRPAPSLSKPDLVVGVLVEQLVMGDDVDVAVCPP